MNLCDTYRFSSRYSQLAQCEGPLTYYKYEKFLDGQCFAHCRTHYESSRFHVIIDEDMYNVWKVMNV